MNSRYCFTCTYVSLLSLLNVLLVQSAILAFPRPSRIKFDVLEFHKATYTRIIQLASFSVVEELRTRAFGVLFAGWQQAQSDGAAAGAEGVPDPPVAKLRSVVMEDVVVLGVQAEGVGTAEVGEGAGEVAGETVATRKRFRKKTLTKSWRAS